MKSEYKIKTEYINIVNKVQKVNTKHTSTKHRQQRKQ